MWRKDLKRVWGQAMDAHSALLAPTCVPHHLFDVLCRRSANFMNACRDCSLFGSVAVHGVYFGRMLSPLVCKCQFFFNLFDFV